MGYDIGEVYQSNSDFLKADDIGSNFWTVTISAVDMKNFDDGTRKLFVMFSELDKGLVLNKTNADTIGDLYGRGTDGWIGRQVMLMTMPVDYQGKKVQAIRVRAVAQQQSMPSRTVAQTSPQRPLNQPQYDERNPPPPTESDIQF